MQSLLTKAIIAAALLSGSTTQGIVIAAKDGRSELPKNALRAEKLGSAAACRAKLLRIASSVQARSPKMGPPYFQSLLHAEEYDILKVIWPGAGKLDLVRTYQCEDASLTTMETLVDQPAMPQLDPHPWRRWDLPVSEKHE